MYFQLCGRVLGGLKVYQYNVYSLTLAQLTEMIASGDDSKRNQIRIKKDGTIFLSTIVGNVNLEEIAGRFETFEANNRYVGHEAAKDLKYITNIFLTIQHWIKNPKPYIDVWIQA